MSNRYSYSLRSGRPSSVSGDSSFLLDSSAPTIGKIKVTRSGLSDAPRDTSFDGYQKYSIRSGSVDRSLSYVNKNRSQSYDVAPGVTVKVPSNYGVSVNRGLTYDDAPVRHLNGVGSSSTYHSYRGTTTLDSGLNSGLNYKLPPTTDYVPRDVSGHYRYTMRDTVGGYEPTAPQVTSSHYRYSSRDSYEPTPLASTRHYRYSLDNLVDSDLTTPLRKTGHVPRYDTFYKSSVVPSYFSPEYEKSRFDLPPSTSHVKVNYSSTSTNDDDLYKPQMYSPLYNDSPLTRSSSLPHLASPKIHLPETNTYKSSKVSYTSSYQPRPLPTVDNDNDIEDKIKEIKRRAHSERSFEPYPSYKLPRDTFPGSYLPSSPLTSLKPDRDSPETVYRKTSYKVSSDTFPGSYLPSSPLTSLKPGRDSPETVYRKTSYKVSSDSPSYLPTSYEPPRYYDLDLTTPDVPLQRTTYKISRESPAPTYRPLSPYEPSYPYDLDLDYPEVQRYHYKLSTSSQPRTRSYDDYPYKSRLPEVPRSKVTPIVEAQNKDLLLEAQKILVGPKVPRDKKPDYPTYEDIGRVPTAPAFSTPLRSKNAYPGQSVRLTCSTHSLPEPKIFWFHNDKPLPGDYRRRISVALLVIFWINNQLVKISWLRL